ncbi:hypothetical protein MFRU_005g02730 [Monilinia fructicola]|nr:hypothetical protein MFRU_005g02730 [Monilinia fructicola]
MESNKNALSSHESDLGGPSTESGMRGEDSHNAEMDVLSGMDDVGNEDAFDNEARDSGEIHRQHGATRESPGQWRIDDGNDEVEREINDYVQSEDEYFSLCNALLKEAAEEERRKSSERGGERVRGNNEGDQEKIEYREERIKRRRNRDEETKRRRNKEKGKNSKICIMIYFSCLLMDQSPGVK